MYLADIYSVAASLAGICAISVPCGQTSGDLPIGVQIMGPHFGEATLLRAGLAVERHYRKSLPQSVHEASPAN
jgi:aspartyl-tRNA(Asn)/glutamyl-tRNA(Gln) amidotransferase subunit A